MPPGRLCLRASAIEYPACTVPRSRATVTPTTIRRRDDRARLRLRLTVFSCLGETSLSPPVLNRHQADRAIPTARAGNIVGPEKAAVNVLYVPSELG